MFLRHTASFAVGMISFNLSNQYARLITLGEKRPRICSSCSVLLSLRIVGLAMSLTSSLLLPPFCEIDNLLMRFDVLWPDRQSSPIPILVRQRTSMKWS